MIFIADEAAFDAPASGIIGSPLFNAPPSLGKMAAGGEWERAEVFQPGGFTSEAEVKRYLGSKDEIACEAFFGDAFFGARKRGTAEALLRFVLDFNRALASSANGRDFFRRVAERPGIPVGNATSSSPKSALWTHGRASARSASKTPAPHWRHFEELLSKTGTLTRRPRTREHLKAVEFAFGGGGCEHWIALPVSEGPLIVPSMLEDALRRWRESSARDHLHANFQNKKA